MECMILLASFFTTIVCFKSHPDKLLHPNFAILVNVKRLKNLVGLRPSLYLCEALDVVYIFCFPQDCYRVLVSLISWPGQLLSLFPCQRLKFLARMLFLGILSLTVVKCRKEEGKDKDEIVLLKQNEISSLIMEAATLKKYIWSCFGQTAPAGCE